MAEERMTAAEYLPRHEEMMRRMRADAEEVILEEQRGCLTPLIKRAKESLKEMGYEVEE